MGVFLDKAYFSFNFLKKPPLLSTWGALLGNVIHTGKEDFYFAHSCLEGLCWCKNMGALGGFTLKPCCTVLVLAINAMQ